MNESLILIEKYLAGQLSSEEIKDFESQCQQDPRLAQELKIALQTRYATEYEGDEILRGRLNKQIQKQRTETQRQIRSLKWYGALAAALLLLVVAIPFLSPMGGAPSPTELYPEYFAKPSNPAPLVRATTADPETQIDTLDLLWKKATTAYSAGDYLGMDSLLNTIITISSHQSDRDQAYFYLGTTRLLLEQPNEAIVAFGQVSLQGSYGDQALWYHALTFLRIDAPENSIPLLTKIAQSGQHYKQQEAVHLLSILK